MTNDSVEPILNPGLRTQPQFQKIRDAEISSAPTSHHADPDHASAGDVACRAARQDLCANQLRTLSLHRSGNPKPTQNRAAVPNPASAHPVETLGEALAEGIVTGHPTMPEFQLDPDQIHDLLSYLKTLE
jgi:hypothetical protein